MTIFSRNTYVSLSLFLLLFVAPPFAVPQTNVRADDEPQFFQRVPADRDNLLFVGDVLPQLEKLLSSEDLRDVLVNGKLAGGALDPQAALPLLKEHADKFPTEVVVALPASSLDDIAHLAHLGMLAGLCSGAGEAGGEAIESDLPKLQKQLLALAKTQRLPEMTVWAQFRSKLLPAQAMAVVRALAPTTIPEGVRTMDEPTAFGLATKVGQLVSTEQIQLVLTILGITQRANDPIGAEIAAALGEIEMELWLEQFDEGLRLSVGQRPLAASEPYTKEHLGELWQPKTPLFYTRWDTESFLAKLEDVRKLWDQWRETETGRALSRLDEEDMIGDLDLIVRQLEQGGRKGSLKMTVGDEIEAVVHTHGLPPAPPLRQSPLMKLIPKDVEVAVLDTSSSMADQFSGNLSSFEDRLSTRALQYEITGKEQQAALADQVIEFYYGKLGEFRKLVHEESYKAFDPPMATLVGSQGKIKKLDVQFEFPAGERNRLVLSDAPMVEFAMVGKMRDVAKARRYFAEVWQAFLGEFIDDLPEPLIRRHDLGLGVPTVVFSGDFWQKMPGKVQVSVEGDLLPHLFIVDSWIVLSTSQRLSKQIVAAYQGDAAERFQLPQDSGEKLVGYGQFPSSTMANYVEDFGELLDGFLNRNGKFTLEGPIFELPSSGSPDLKKEMSGIADVIRLVDKMQWRTSDQGDIRQTRMTISFQED